eukprot:UN17550
MHRRITFWMFALLIYCCVAVPATSKKKIVANMEKEVMWFRKGEEPESVEISTNSIYEGEYASGLREGQGMETKRDGSIYIGGWKAGLKHGHGSEKRQTAQSTRDTGFEDK